METYNTAQLMAMDREVEIYYLPEKKQPIKKDVPCKRCHGTGIIKSYMHVLGGICFRCWGQCIELTNEERIAAAKIAKDTLSVFK